MIRTNKKALVSFSIITILLLAILFYNVNANLILTNREERLLSELDQSIQNYNAVVLEYQETISKYNDLVESYNDLVNAFDALQTETSGSEISLVPEIHACIRIWDDGELILDEYHAGSMTNLGLNVTLAKLTGDDTFFNMTQYNLNATYISIGDATGGHNASSVVLDSEWNRTAGTVEDEAYNSYNLTCTFYPDSSGPYTADCIGINFESGIGNNALYGFDTFTQITGIDETFTITVEFKLSIS